LKVRELLRTNLKTKIKKKVGSSIFWIHLPCMKFCFSLPSLFLLLIIHLRKLLICIFIFYLH
jgi:hypothetical protein